MPDSAWFGELVMSELWLCASMYEKAGDILSHYPKKVTILAWFGTVQAPSNYFCKIKGVFDYYSVINNWALEIIGFVIWNLFTKWFWR